MNWKLLGQTFGAVFIAEMGDKTQLATFSFAAGGSSRWAVFAGSALALVATSAIAVLVGGAITRVVSPIWIRRAAGSLFIVLGLLYLFGRGEPPADQGQSSPSPSPAAPTAAKDGPSGTSSDG